MFVRNIAGLCKGSTADSDSVCEGSNPSPAAKRLSAYAGSFFFCHGSVIGIRTLTQIQSGRSSRRLRRGFESFSRCQKTLSLCWEFFLLPWFCHRDSRAAEGSGSYSENMRTCPPSGASRAAYRPCFSRAAKTGRSPAAAAPCMPAGRNCPARTSG